MKRSKCLVTIKDPPSPRVTLLCCHYAGGSAGVFHGWGPLLPDWIRLVALEMPGRGARFKEHPLVKVDQVVGEIMRDVPEDAGEQLVLFGHSLGGLIAFEAARSLERSGALAPKLLIVSGRLPPHVAEDRQSTAYKRKQARNFVPVHRLDDKAFIEELRHLNGTPRGVLENERLMEICIPYLRADFRINEEYRLVDRTRLTCPLVTMGGERDYDVPLAQLRCWSELTEGYCEHYTFRGDHFFTHSHEEEVVAAIVSAIVNRIRGRESRERAALRASS